MNLKDLGNRGKISLEFPISGCCVGTCVYSQIMSTEATITIFRATRPFFGQFIARGAPAFHGVDKRSKAFDSVSHYLGRGANVQLSDRNWRTVSLEAEDFGVDETFESNHSRK